MARTTIPGAEIGTIVGAAKGAPLEGLGIGSAAGAATGLVWILATRGKDVVLPHGTSLELQLSQPVTFDREEVEPPSRYDAGPRCRAGVRTAQLMLGLRGRWTANPACHADRTWAVLTLLRRPCKQSLP